MRGHYFIKSRPHQLFVDAPYVFLKIMDVPMKHKIDWVHMRSMYKEMSAILYQCEHLCCTH